MGLKKIRSKSRADKRRQSQKLKIISLSVLGLVLLTILIFHRALSTWASSAMVRDSEHFCVERVTVSGCKVLTIETILEQAGVRRGSSLFAIKPEAVEQRVRNLAWVKSCRVIREFPNTVSIRIEERQPVAALRAETMFAITEDSIAVLPPNELWVWDLPILTPPRQTMIHEGDRISNKELLSLLQQAACARRVSKDTWQSISEMYFRGDEIYATLIQPAIELRLGNGAGELAWFGLESYVSRSGGVTGGHRIDISVPGKLIVSTETPKGEERVNG